MVSDPISLLNHLVEVCRNGERGFREAAAVVKDRHLSAIFLEFSEQRDQFAAQLRYQVSRLGGRPTNTGTLGGVLHRRWIDLRSGVSGGAYAPVVAEAVRGEEHALRAYEDALSASLPPEIRNLLVEQHAQIKAAQENLRALAGRLRHEPAF